MFELKPWQIAGFDLYGVRQPDGKILIGVSDNPQYQTLLDDFPECVELKGVTYTLEEVRKNKDICTPPLREGHPGYYIEWGIYV